MRQIRKTGAFALCLLLSALCLAVGALAAEEPDYSTLTEENGKLVNSQGVVFTLQEDGSNTAWVGTGGTAANNSNYTSANPNFNDGNVVIPDVVTYNGQTYAVTYISTNAFRGVRGAPNEDIKTVTIGANVRDIAFSAFYYCSKLTEFKVDEASGSFCTEDGILFDKSKVRLRCMPGGKAMESYEIPAGVRYVDEGSFLGCQSIEEVKVGKDVRIICDYAFFDAVGLRKATVTGVVEMIGNQAFEGCVALESLSIDKGVKVIGWRLCYGCSALRTLYVYSGVKAIAPYPLVGCTALETLTLPFLGTTDAQENQISEASAIAPCWLGYLFVAGEYTVTGDTHHTYVPKSLTEVTIAAGTLKEKAFRMCSSIEKITLGRAIVEIPGTCFGYCTALRQLDMGLTAELDGTNHAAADKNGNTIVQILPHIQTIGSWAFYACPHIYRFSVDEKNAGYANDYWGVLYDKDFKTLLCYPPASDCQYYCVKGSAELVASFAFSQYCNRVITVNIPNGDTDLGRGSNNKQTAFYDQLDVKVCVHERSKAESALGLTNGQTWTIEYYKPERVDIQRLADNLGCEAGVSPAFENLHLVAAYPGTTILLDPLDYDLTYTALKAGTQTATATYHQKDASGKALSVSFQIYLFAPQENWSFREFSLANSLADTVRGARLITAFYEAGGKLLGAYQSAAIDNVKAANSLRCAVYAPDAVLQKSGAVRKTFFLGADFAPLLLPVEE